jgi:purine catabolism regulator
LRVLNTEVRIRSMLTLADVIDQQEFGLTLVTGGDPGLRRPIAGAHNSEMAEPAEFLPPQWLLLTLGMTLKRDLPAQRALIANLDDAGVSALGFGVGVAFEQVPRALIEEAARRAFPVFEIPYETPYREIIGFVNRSLLSSDYRQVHRSLSMQTYLMDALREEHPTGVLVRRLDELLNSTILLLNADGSVEAASRDAPADEIWAEVREREETSVHRALVAGAPILSVPIDVANRPRRWLVVVSHGRSLPAPLATSVIRSSERLLELITLSQRAADAEDRVRRAELLTAALQSLSGQPSDHVKAGLASYGIDFDIPARMLVVKSVSKEELADDHLRLTVERTLAADAVPYLGLSRGREFLALIQVDHQSLPSVTGAILDALDSCAIIGAGRPVRSPADARDSVRDAEAAVAELAYEGRTGVRLFEELRLAGWLLGNAPPSALRAAVDAILGPLDDRPDLYNTLTVYLQHHGRVASAAKALNLHDNSMRYRLSRIETLLGRSLSDFATLVDIHLATLAREVTDPLPSGTEPPPSCGG